jgi:hypothetical protein
VAVPVADLRRLPDHRVELVSQGLFGETFRVLESSPDGKWLRVRGELDGYSGWARTWSFASGSRAAARAWRTRARWRVHAPWYSTMAGALPYGSRLARDGARVMGPLGPVADRASAGIRPAVEGPAGGRDGRLGRAIVATARRFTGASYHWGGRTFAGIDCSGLVQLAAGAHGLRLPRDAREQCRALGGVARLLPLERALGGGSGEPPAIRPGDLWFFGPTRREVTHVAISTGGLGLVHAYGRVAVGSLDPPSAVFEPELFRFLLGWRTLPARSPGRTS